MQQNFFSQRPTTQLISLIQSRLRGLIPCKHMSIICARCSIRSPTFIPAAAAAAAQRSKLSPLIYLQNEFHFTALLSSMLFPSSREHSTTCSNVHLNLHRARLKIICSGRRLNSAHFFFFFFSFLFAGSCFLCNKLCMEWNDRKFSFLFIARARARSVEFSSTF